MVYYSCMNKEKCPHFVRSDSANPDKIMRLQVTAQLDGENLPVFGERREFSGRKPNDTTILHICGICKAIKTKVAVETERYENFCMQSLYPDCGRYKNASEQTAKAE